MVQPQAVGTRLPEIKDRPDINGGNEDKVNDIGLLASYNIMVTLLLALHKIWSLNNYM